MKTLENQAKNAPNVHITMGRRSKATIARINNLEKVKNAQQPSVEDVEEDEDMDFEADDLLEEGFFFLDETDALDEESDGYNSGYEEEGEGELDRLQNEAEIKHFNAVLFMAQAMAVKAECEAQGEKPKRKHHYTGNSDRTK